MVEQPHPNMYRVGDSSLWAGEYPGRYPYRTEEWSPGEKVGRWLDAGFNAFVDLTGGPGLDPTEPYEEILREEASCRGIDTEYHRYPIPDNGTPRPERMRDILNTINDALERGRKVYVHCWGGVGRTGTVIGCHLVDRGMTAPAALDEVGRLFRMMSTEKCAGHPEGSPQTLPQREFVRRWAEKATTHDPIPQPAGTVHTHRSAATTGRSRRNQKYMDTHGADRTLLADHVRRGFAARGVPEDVDETCIRVTVETTEAEGRRRQWPCVAVIGEFDEYLRVYAYAPQPLPLLHLPQLLRFLAQANHGLAGQTLELDVDNAELRSRASLPIDLVSGPDAVSRLLSDALGGIQAADPALRRIAAGERPEAVLEDGETIPLEFFKMPLMDAPRLAHLQRSRPSPPVGPQANTAPRAPRHPLPRSVRLDGTRIWVGESPARKDAAETRENLRRLLDAGITRLLDLSGGPEAERCRAELRELGAAGVPLACDASTPIPSVPGASAPSAMRAALDRLEQHYREGHAVYVHATGFGGRLAAFLACHLMRAGHTVQEALARVEELSEAIAASAGLPTRPMQAAWRAFAEAWQEDDTRLLLTPGARLPLFLRDQVRGSLIGLAVGDALGAAVEFQAPGSFVPVSGMRGGGQWKLKPGQWTDDTSMALCLAESLIEQRDFDPRDQMERYVRWWKEGHLSSTGKFFDIGTTTSAALGAFLKTGAVNQAVSEGGRPTNGSLMRLAPAAIFRWRDPGQAIPLAARSSCTTHPTHIAVDACRYLAALIVGALQGATRRELLEGCYEPTPGYWEANPLHPAVAEIANGSFRRKDPPQIQGTGHAAEALEAALWAFHRSSDFREGCLRAVNLGDDADTTGAIYGQLAGAFYGESAVPLAWREALAHRDLLDRYAETLFLLSVDPHPKLSPAREQNAAELVGSALREWGTPACAVRNILRQEEEAKTEMGEMAYYMSGSMGAAAARSEALFQLRVRMGLDLVHRAGESRR